jgi:hypothetical protein
MAIIVSQPFPISVVTPPRTQLTALRASKFWSAAVLFFAALLSVNAATYYIDYSNGSDTNTGTSKSAPWKRQPYMSGFAGSYTHQAGDRFIFKGGVTWTAGSLPMSIPAGGNSGVRDYYGVDQTWYTGASWSQPVFDKQRNGDKCLILQFGVRYVTFDNLDIKNPQVGSTFAVGCVILNGNQDITFQYCHIHDWYRVSAAQVPDGGTWGGIINNPFGQVPTQPIQNFLVTHCEIDNTNGGGIGGAIYYAGEVAYSKIHHVSNGLLLGNQNIHDSEFYQVNTSPDGPAAHTNVIYVSQWGGSQNVTNIPALLYTLYLHDCTAAETIYVVLDNSATGGIGTKNIYVYNNVQTNCNKGVDIDPAGNGTGPSNIFVYNNTFELASGAFVRSAKRPGSPPAASVTSKNNHFIGSGSSLQNDGGTPTIVQSNNIQHASTAIAAAAGYLSAASFAPAGGSGVTVNAGLNLSSTGFPAITLDTSRGGLRTAVSRGSTWDIGAYKYNGAAAPPPTPTPTATPNGAPTATPNGAPTATPTPTSTPTPSPGSTPSTVLGLVFDSTGGLISPPFAANADNTISQAFQTVDPTQGGSAVFSFNVSIAGDYVVSASVNAPDSAANSFFVDIDSQPLAPLAIWDVSTTSGFEQRIVSWRGNGTDVDSEFAPKVFTLTQGVHQLIIRGRESGTKLGQITVGKLPAPPGNLRPVVGP